VGVFVHCTVFLFRTGHRPETKCSKAHSICGLVSLHVWIQLSPVVPSGSERPGASRFNTA